MRRRLCQQTTKPHPATRYDGVTYVPISKLEPTDTCVSAAAGANRHKIDDALQRNRPHQRAEIPDFLGYGSEGCIFGLKSSEADPEMETRTPAEGLASKALHELVRKDGRLIHRSECPEVSMLQGALPTQSNDRVQPAPR